MTDIIIKMAASSTTLTAVADETVLSTTSAGESTQNGPRKWERPWSVQEIHAEAGNWSLAGDSGLLQHLQEFSQRVISRTHHIGKEVDDLVHEAKLMDVRVGNVINDFIMLANTQFVENRVYDEDVSQEPTSKEEKKVEQKTKEQREAELIPRVSLALKLGVDVIENSFVKLDTRVVDSDSEEEDNAYISEPILEAKDPYVSRPLPFLIGTPQFMEDDNVGLLDESSDEEKEVDQGSISVSEEDKDGDESDSEYSASEESEEEERKKVAHRKHRAQTKTSAVSESSDADSSQDIFSDKRSGSQKSGGGDSGDISDSEGEDDDDVQEKPAALPRGPKDFNAELAARLGTAAPKQAADRQEADDQWKDKSADYRSQDSLSSGVHQNVGHKGKKNRSNMEVKTDKGADKNKHSKNIVEDDDLFAQDNGQDDDDIFSKDKGLFSSSKGLFDDDDEDADKEGGLFADVKKPPPKVQKSDKKADSLFSDGITNDEIEDRPRTNSGRQVPTGGVSIFGTGEDLTAASKLESSGTHIIKKPTAQPAVASNKSAGGKAASGGGGGGGLFDESEEEEDDLFSGASKKLETDRKASSHTGKATATAAKKSDLFADAEDDSDDLFGSMAAATTKKKAPGNVGITVESYDEEERVKEKRLEDEQLRKQATPEKKLPPGAVSMFGKSPNPLVEALKSQQQTVSSEEEDNYLSEEGRNSLTSSIHSTSSTTLPPAQKSTEGTRNMGSSSSRTSSIFTDDRAEDDLFSIKPKSDSKSVTDSQGSRKLPELDHKAPSKVRSVKDSLFDSSGDDEDVDIFSSIAKPAASTKADKGVSLFGDIETTGTAKAGTAAASRLASQPANRRTGASLFDDNQEGEAAEPLFPGQLLDSAGGKDTPKNKTQGLFVRDDLLFGTSADEDPFVDLFSSKAPVTESHTKEIQKHTTSQTSTSAGRPAATSLFDGGDDGDDDSGLFSVTPVTKPAAATPVSVAAAPASVAAPMMKTISGVTETESTDTAEVKVKEKPEVKEIRKPAGGVSIFGGLDPASVLAKKPTLPSNEDEMSKGVQRDDREIKKDEKVTRTEEKTTGKTPVLKPKPSTDLFGGGKDDDDDDLFSPKATVKTLAKADVPGESTHVSTKEGAATPKAEPMKPRKPAGAVPMFGGVDPLAFLKKESVAEIKDETTDEGNERGKPSPPLPAPKPKVMPREKQEENLKIKPQNGAAAAAAELFGDDGDDSDDLFVVSKQKASPPQVAPKSKAATSHSSVGSPKSEREPQSPTVARAKALAGAVPMFRGIDPFAGMKKKSLSSEPEEDSSSQKEKPPTFVDPLAVLTSSVPSTAALKHPASPVIVAKRSVDMSAAINSTYMLPDDTRSDQDTDLEKSGSLDFEESTETETLTSASKDRPKLSRRRPQSRKARVLAAAQTGINFGDGSTTTPPDPAVFKMPDVADKPHPGTVESSNGAIPGPVLGNHLGDSKKFASNPKSADLFGNDDLLDGLTVSADQLLPVGVRKTVNDEIFSKDLFYGSSRISNGAAEDLFSGFNKQKDIPPARSEIIAEKTTANEKDEIDGLFSKPSGKTKTDSLSAFLGNNGDLYPTSPLTTRSKAKVDQDIDDLFTSSAKSSTRKSNLASEIVKGDDLFSAPKSSSSLSRGGSIADAKSADIFEDIHDVFGASSVGRHKDTSSVNPEKDGLTGARRQDSKNVRPKQPVTKEANLLMDDTDIFSDVPKPTPREPKKKSSKKVVEKNVFRDDIDDIFANTTAATIKPKKEVRKKVTKPAAVISDNIFDDPLS